MLLHLFLKACFIVCYNSVCAFVLHKRKQLTKTCVSVLFLTFWKTKMCFKQNTDKNKILYQCMFFFWLGLKRIPLSSKNPNVVWPGQICMCLRAECELTIQTIRNFPDLNVSEKNQQWCCHCSPLWSFCYLASFTLTSSVRLRGHMERVDTNDHKHKKVCLAAEWLILQG